MAMSPTKRVKNKTKEFKMPPLTSLMDAITILTFFLLTQMSTSTILHPLIESVPKSTVENEVVKGLVLGLDRSGLFQDLGQTVKEEQRKILLASPSEMESPELDIPALTAVLSDEIQRTQARGLPPHTITLMVDSLIKYSWVLKVINTAGNLNYPKIDFVVLKGRG
ncbi:MAG: biopolymer transporter ExbD [bacterium]|nr:biopolymer transporter ExbD [bacterium]